MYLKKLLGSTETLPTSADRALPRMSLEQRKAYRHEMVYQSIREKLLQLGALPSMYRFQVRAVDERWHRFHVAIEVSSAFQIQLQNRPLDFAQIASLLRRHSHAGYGLVIEKMDWQVNASVASFTRERRAQDVPGAVIKPHSPLHKQMHPVYARKNFAPVPAQDGRLFIEALRQRQTPPPVRVGTMAYASDFIPLYPSPLPDTADDPTR